MAHSSSDAEGKAAASGDNTMVVDLNPFNHCFARFDNVEEYCATARSYCEELLVQLERTLDPVTGVELRTSDLDMLELARPASSLEGLAAHDSFRKERADGFEDDDEANAGVFSTGARCRL